MQQPPGQGNEIKANLMGFVNASASVFGGIGNKLFGSSSPQQNVSLAPEIVAKRALQSQLIRLRVLAHERKFEEILRIVETTDDFAIASAAVAEIVQAPEDVDRILMLDQLACGRSKGCLRAIVALINLREFKLALLRFTGLLNTGQLQDMIASGTVKLFSVLDIMGFFDQALETNSALERLEWFVQSAGGPEQQLLVLAEILGDAEPGGYRYIHDPNGIPAPVKLKAVELLQNFTPAQSARALWYASREDDDTVSYNATVALIKYWTDKGLVPEGIEPFPMLDISLLFYLSQMASSFRWPESAHAQPILDEYTSITVQLESLAPNDPSATKLQSRLDDVTRKLVRITDERINSLQPLVDKIVQQLNLPYAQVRVSERDGGCAAYVIGAGRIEINRKILLQDKLLSEELMSALLHEIGHMTQDVLVIRMIADDLGIIFGQHGKHLTALWEQYSKELVTRPNICFF
jgi:hypothetical protein